MELLNPDCNQEKPTFDQSRAMCQQVPLAIEMVGNSPVPRIVLFEIRVEQVGWNCVTGCTVHVVTPHPNRNRPTLDEHCDDRLFRHQIAHQIPWLVFPGLPTVCIQMYATIRLLSGSCKEYNCEYSSNRISGFITAIFDGLPMAFGYYNLPRSSTRS
jgi:hypothetical protein